ncbi:MAG: PEP-CTERM sorting domain-containing protein [Phycisphaerales bacterium]|nr:PEP-CTERM sorting domain-containing protein [Phycisphaerales bacterium]
MKNSVLALALAAGAVTTANAAVLTSWSFENLSAGFTVTGAASGNVASTGGLFAGNASGQHAASTTNYSSPTGNGSTRSFSANAWAVGDYFQFTSSSLGYNNIKISWGQTGSNTGPRDFGLFYSTDGVSFTQIGANYIVRANAGPAWSSGTGVPTDNQTVSGPSALDNKATIYFRLVNRSTTSTNGGSVAAGGTSRVDDVIIEGTAIPAPASLALAGLGGLIAARRRRA